MIKVLPLLAVLMCMAVTNTSCIKAGDAAVAPTPSNIDKDNLMDLVNGYRRSGCNCGTEYMPPVSEIRWNDTLERAARDHSDDMNNKNYFDHTGSDGSQPWDRITRYGYRYTACGENIAQGYPTGQAVIEGWMKSPGHCKNIMNAAYKDMGVATSGKYWTQVFATH